MTFVEFNVWLDAAFVVLYLLVWAFLIFHFTMGIVKGRARKKFIEHQWPSHDSVPPVAPKLMHATHMISMLILGFSGMYIRFPFFDGGRVAMRYVHYIFMIIVTIILVARIWYAFWSKRADWREFAVGKEDWASAVGVLAYYGYFSNKKPHVAKYNVMQKLSYQLFLVMMVLQAFTGFALVTTPILLGSSPRDLLIGWWLGAFAGGVDLAGWGVRTVHYILNWGFIIMTTVHVYLSATEDVPCTLDFFGIKPLEIDPDAHGQGHGHDEPALKPVPSIEPGSGQPA